MRWLQGLARVALAMVALLLLADCEDNVTPLDPDPPNRPPTEPEPDQSRFMDVVRASLLRSEAWT